MPARIGFDLDVPEEEDDEEGEEFDVEMVGQGCADFTPVEEPFASLDDMVQATRKLKRMGAKKVIIGGFSVEF